jgi:hypothetical protein
MSLYDQYETSPKSELEDGIMVQIPQPPDEPAKFWMKRAGGANIAYTKFVERENRNVRVAGKEMSAEFGEDILRQALAHHLIFKWENVTDRKGKALALTPENAIKILTDLPSLIMILHTQASNPDNFLAADSIMEEEAKN